MMVDNGIASPVSKKLKSSNSNTSSSNGVDNVTEESNISLNPSLLLTSFGISAEEMQCAVNVLTRLADGLKTKSSTTENAYSQLPRPIRKAIAPFVEMQISQRFQGKSPQEYISDKLAKQQAHQQKMKETCQQRKYIDTTQLRKARIDKLNALLLSNNQQQDDDDDTAMNSLKYLIPDGPATENTTAPNSNHTVPNMTMMIENTNDENDSSSLSSSTILLPKLRSCYTCKRRFRELHHFYDQLCPPCALLNYNKRMQLVDLTGYIAVVTGSRVKIGFHTCLKLLRSNCMVIATTRFPNSACKAYREQPDFESFKHNLHIYGLDLRNVVSIESFVHFIKKNYAKVDILINNACQTIRRPAGYYLPAVLEEQRLYQEASEDHHLLISGMKTFEQLQQDQHHPQLLLAPPTTTTTITSNNHNETSAITTRTPNDVMTNGSNPAGFESTGISHSAAMSQMTLLPEDEKVDTSVLPSGLKDINGQQLDLRRHNSWLLKMDQVSTPEMVETMFINAIAPFILNSRLKPLMMNGAHDRFIINVSAMEGKFYRYKTPNHPHTNMAKAALNMLTRTSSEDLAKNCRIYMNSVDTGWINDENPLEKASKIAKENHFQTPIDEVDAASRILDPIFSAICGETTPPAFGMFFKDYKPTEW